MRKYRILLFTVMIATASVSHAQSFLDKLKKVVKEKTDTTTKTNTTITNSSVTAAVSSLSTTDVSSALKQALNTGVEDGVKKLGVENGFFGNSLVKILLPEKLQKIEKAFRAVGLGSLADQGVKLLNRAAEDAVTESVPIFANAITSMSFADAKKILLGSDTAATSYLQNKTTSQLVTAFKPKVEQSLGKVGADKVWSQLVSKYNAISHDNMTTDLNQYVTEGTISGVFKMVAQKEEGIRSSPALRTTSVLKNVFGALDK
ncbi:Protein of unknown function [bacterium A37T11]|nr:Protein of unknown function [bacterium A37T11]